MTVTTCVPALPPMAVTIGISTASATIWPMAPSNREITSDARIVLTSVTSSQLPGSGEPDAAWTPPTWEEIVEQHSARVYRLAYRLTGNPHDAEEVAQDALVRAYRALGGYDPQRIRELRLRAWLATIVVPGQQTAFGLFTGPSSRDVERALLAAGPGVDRVSAAWRVTADDHELPRRT